MSVDFKEMLKEVERLRTLLNDREKHIQFLGSEMNAFPSLVEINANQMLLKN